MRADLDTDEEGSEPDTDLETDENELQDDDGDPDWISDSGSPFSDRVYSFLNEIPGSLDRAIKELAGKLVRRVHRSSLEALGKYSRHCGRAIANLL
jgi:hypothetical protein